MHNGALRDIKVWIGGLGEASTKDYRYLGEWGCLALSPPVDGHKAGGADVEGVVLVVVELLLIHGVLVAGLQDFPANRTELRTPSPPVARGGGV